MIRLGVAKEPAWLELEHGVRVLARPLTTIVMESARQRAAGELRELREAIDRVKAAHGDVSGLPALEDPAVQRAEMLTRLVKALAHYAITQWDGVLGVDGQPAPCEPATIAELMDVPAISQAFFDRYTETIAAREAEKNG